MSADLLPITLDDQIAAVLREIAMRERVYPRQIGSGRMSPDKARRELALMRAVPGNPDPAAGGAMTAWESPGKVAVHALHKHYGLDEAAAEAAVNAVFSRLAEPDRDMLEAGAAEMAQALPKGARRSYARQLAAIVWRAMIERARP